MPEVFDLDALAHEATGEPFVFQLGGQHFTLPAVRQLDRRHIKRVSEALAGADVDAALTELLGDQWDRFDSLPLTVGQLNSLLDAWQVHQGLKPGESDASTDS